MDYNSSAVGAVLRSYRLKYNLSQVKLSHYLGISQSTVADIENGAIRKGNIGTYIKFAEYFGISLDTLFKDNLCVLKNDKENQKDIQIIDELMILSKDDLQYINQMVSAFLKYEKLNKQDVNHET